MDNVKPLSLEELELARRAVAVRVNSLKSSLAYSNHYVNVGLNQLLQDYQTLESRLIDLIEQGEKSPKSEVE